ncbi:ORF6N domain-containing protein [Anatilimnocola sp. NA78]|uniref:ORF6N domain-containing protein n=1 Tax=Anatilimnocola sp. NA78 TaxID=3415683 RepID=UPI003CE4BC82
MAENLVPAERIQQSILFIREQKVLLDKDLALLYGVTTANLNKAVSRNQNRFPDDFMFQLTKEEAENLMFQIGISSSGKHDEQFRIASDAIRQLMASPEPPPKRKIGYRADVSS